MYMCMLGLTWHNDSGTLHILLLVPYLEARGVRVLVRVLLDTNCLRRQL